MHRQIEKTERLYLSIYGERLDSIRLKHEYPEIYNASLKQNPKKIDWNLIASNQTLSENFIREFQDRVNWDDISYYQTLSEPFIREFQDRVNWYEISAYQMLSKEFRKEFNIE